MALNQKRLKEKLEAWAKLRTQLDKAAARKNRELDPFIREHNERVAPIIEKYDAKYNPLVEKSNELSKEIAAMLEANVDADGKPKPMTVTSGAATATISKSEGSRIVSVQKFFDAVKTKTAAFWECVGIQVVKAEKLLGKAKLDEISEKKTKYAISISLNK